MYKLTCGLIVVSALNSFAHADPPPPGRIAIDLVTVNGSGCPSGTAVQTSPDNTSFFVSYSSYLAEAGVGADPTDFRKNCQLNVLVHVPQGFSFAIAEADYSGFAALASGATAVQRANYYFAGETPTAVVSHAFSGPLEDDWRTVDSADVATLVFSPCGVSRNLNINTELRVSNGTSDPAKTTNWIAMDATHASVQNIFHFAWKRCP
jgi:hypothetical protein